MSIFRTYHGSEGNRCTIRRDDIIIGGKLFGKKIPYSSITSCHGMSFTEKFIGSAIIIKFCANGESHELNFRSFDSAGRNVDGRAIYDYIIDQSAMPEADKIQARKNIDYPHATIVATAAQSGMLTSQSNASKDASVVGRAIVGGVIAGPTGAVVGALSAVDKNNKNKK